MTASPSPRPRTSCPRRDVEPATRNNDTLATEPTAALSSPRPSPCPRAATSRAAPTVKPRPVERAHDLHHPAMSPTVSALSRPGAPHPHCAASTTSFATGELSNQGYNLPSVPKTIPWFLANNRPSSREPSLLQGCCSHAVPLAGAAELKAPLMSKHQTREALPSPKIAPPAPSLPSRSSASFTPRSNLELS